jgi:hypothetical protein
MSTSAILAVFLFSQTLSLMFLSFVEESGAEHSSKKRRKRDSRPEKRFGLVLYLTSNCIHEWLLIC